MMRRSLPAYALGALDEDERRLVEEALASDPDVRALLAEYEAGAAFWWRSRRCVRRRSTCGRILRPVWLLARGDAAAHPWSSSPRAALVADGGRRAGGDRAGSVAVLLLREEDEPPPVTPGMGNGASLYTELAEQDGALWYDVMPTELDPDVSGALVVSPEGDRAVIRLEDLPPLSPDEVFQLWLVDADGQRIDGGLFRQSEDDATYIEVPLAAPIDRYLRFGASLEPAGEAHSLTSRPVRVFMCGLKNPSASRITWGKQRDPARAGRSLYAMLTHTHQRGMGTNAPPAFGVDPRFGRRIERARFGGRQGELDRIVGQRVAQVKPAPLRGRQPSVARTESEARCTRHAGKRGCAHRLPPARRSPRLRRLADRRAPRASRPAPRRHTASICRAGSGSGARQQWDAPRGVECDGLPAGIASTIRIVIPLGACGQIHVARVAPGSNTDATSRPGPSRKSNDSVRQRASSGK